MTRRAPPPFSSIRIVLEHQTLRDRLEQWTSLLSQRYNSQMFYTRNRVPEYVEQPMTDAFFMTDGSGQIRSATIQALYVACYPSAITEDWRTSWTCLQSTVPDTDDDAVWEVIKLAASCFGTMGGTFLGNSVFVQYVQSVRGRDNKTSNSASRTYPDRLPNLVSDMTPIPSFVGSHTWIPARYVDDLNSLRDSFSVVETVKDTILLRVSSEPFDWSKHAYRLAEGERCLSATVRSDRGG